MTTSTYLYVKPAWELKNTYNGHGAYYLDAPPSTTFPSSQWGGPFYVQSLTLYFYGIPGAEIVPGGGPGPGGTWPNGLIGGTYSSPSESVTINPPTPAAISLAAYAKYGAQTPRQGTWHGTTYRPERNHDVWVTGHGNAEWDIDGHGPAHSGPNHYSHYMTGEFRTVLSDFPSSQTTSVSWTHSPGSGATHSGLDLGKYYPSDNRWVVSSSTVSLSSPDWHAKIIGARFIVGGSGVLWATGEAAVEEAISQNGLYPEYDEAAVAKFGTYDVAANTYTAGSTDRLSATEWYAETLKASNALAIARAEIDRLLGQNLEAVSKDEPPVEETLRPEEFDQSPWVSGGVADDPLIELPEFISPEIVEPQDEEVESPPDDVVAPGLLRRASFAPPTQDVSAFSESTYNDLTFSPRETVSPEFPKEEPDA